MLRRLAVLLVASAALACGSTDGGSDTTTPPTGPGATRVTVRFVYRAQTARRTDLPPQMIECVMGVGPTHLHPSWRQWIAIPLTTANADQWEITLNDVPVGSRQAIRISDSNVCDENPTGAATRNVFANDVRLTDIVTTPGSGPEPGLAFTVDASGRITP